MNADKLTVVSTTREGNEVLPEGIYTLEVVEFEERVGPKGPYWNFTCDVTDDAHRGQKVWHIVSLSKSAQFRMNEFLDAFAVPENLTITGKDFVGRVAVAQIYHDEYEGQKKAKIKVWLASTTELAKAKLPKAKATVVVESPADPVVVVEEESVTAASGGPADAPTTKKPW